MSMRELNNSPFSMLCEVRKRNSLSSIRTVGMICICQHLVQFSRSVVSDSATP